MVYDRDDRRTALGGTWARMSVPSPTTSTAVYNVANRLTQWNGVNLTYDANGNLTGDGLNNYIWNERNQLSTVKDANTGATLASFVYGPFGRRLQNSAGDQVLYDGQNEVQELSGATPVVNRLTGNLDEFFTRTDSSGTTFPLTDALGNTLALTDSSGATQTQYTYEPFGGTTTTGAMSANTHQFTGRVNDGTGLCYYRARYYSPRFQRFISEDPIGTNGGVNIYAYTLDNPTNLTDPQGLFAPPWHVSITDVAALEAGYNPGAAAVLAARTAWVDARGCLFGSNCSQNPDAGHANTHAMSGRKPSGHPQNCQEAFKGSQQQLADDLRSGDIPKALHTIEDSYASGHRGFQYWPGGLPSWSHEKGDWFPSYDAVGEATHAAEQFLEDMHANITQLNQGSPIDTAKYFPSNPCGN